MDLAQFTPVPWPDEKPGDWLREQLPKGGKIGFDPWLHTKKELDEVRAALEKTGITLSSTPNFVDAIWSDQPDAPLGPIAVHPIEFAGEEAADKRARLAKGLRDAGQKAAVLTLPDSISWLCNIRGADIPRNPVVQAFAILHDDAIAGPVRGRGQAVGPGARASGAAGQHCHPPEGFAAALAALTGPVRLDPASAPLAVSMALEEAGVAIDWAEDPCLLPKARKNVAEIAGMAEAHLRDAAAMVEFLCWFDAQAPKGGLSEIDVVTALEGFRAKSNALRDISFETICGAGPNGAIMHYRVTDDTNRPLSPGEIVVIDSGAQYLDGTTDITRTVPVGAVGEDERACFHPRPARHDRDQPDALAQGPCRAASGRAGALSRCGWPGRISIMAPGMAWAPTCRFTKARSGCRAPGLWRWNPE